MPAGTPVIGEEEVATGQVVETPVVTVEGGSPEVVESPEIEQNPDGSLTKPGQSWKDKAYKTEAELAATAAERDELKAKVESLTRSAPLAQTEPAKPDEDPVHAELAPYAQLLNAKIDSGEIEREEANRLYAAQYKETKRDMEIQELKKLVNQQNALITGSQMQSSFREAMLDGAVGADSPEEAAQFVATPGSALEKEVLRLTQERGIDVTNPQTFAGASREQIRQFVDEYKYIAMRNIRRASGTRPTVTNIRPLPASGGTQPVIQNAPPVRSYDDAKQRAIERFGP